MVHISEMPEHLANALINQELPVYESTPWTDLKSLKESRVALISTAGLHRSEDSPFVAGAGDYRIIPDEWDMDDLVMSHLSTNFDRTGFFQDLNTVFPIDRLHELAEEGAIGSVASRHYSFMGATPPHLMETVARDLAGLLKEDRVNAVLLVPV
ncbi:MAG: selenoprotein B glycine/betaine/sarcosine/D-proline reductase [Alphaproteobacteria bacterium]|jgi:D-proline reductase (dithiol) PrdB|nr:selenoprotein B glycine/betaine/sarcosine/D-proline reductase [Alphaproteobacteria bacterium]PPR13890.1 MAG: D-proline reductase subunit gamma [Alphaproteobacteria bacterium MarineAlpha12_Bin1]